MGSGADEQTLITLAGEGDAEAIGFLYELYADRIYRFALLRLANPADAEDLTQRVFVKMIEHISSFNWKGPGSFTAWLYRIAYNQVVDSMRTSARRPQVALEPIQDHVADDATDPHNYAEQQEFLGQVRNCMDELTELQLQVIMLRYGAELSRSEVAEMLDRTQDTVAVVQHQALKKLRGLMKLRGYETYRT